MPGPIAAPVSAESVRTQLARILASDGFLSSPRLCRFLRFIVERTLDQNLDRLKEFVVALEVFDRDETYDSTIDSIVRVEARRLRTRLKAYYDGPGRADPVRITLRPGSYVPSFHLLAPGEAAAPDRPSTTIAVLPFVNMSPEPEQDYFCDGITEEIINALASVENLAVVARTSAFQFKGQALDLREVGQRLGVQVIVEGSVRKAGQQLRITAQAIDTMHGYHLWSETYRRELRDVFAIQEEISAAIAETMRVRLPARVRRAPGQPPSLEAYQAFFQALHLVHQGDVQGVQAAIAQFEDLTRRFPDYADPYAGLATAHAALSVSGLVAARDVLPELRRHAEQAVRLNPESAAGWTAMAGLSAHGDFDWDEADRRFRRAIALQPSSYTAHGWYAMVLAMRGRFAAAEAELDLALKLDPLGASGYVRQGMLAYLRQDAPSAFAWLGKALRLAPDHPDACLLLGLLHLRQSDPGAAIEVLSRHLDTRPLPEHLGALAAAHARARQPEKSRRLLAELDVLARRQYVSPLARVLACLGLSNLDGAFEALDRAVGERAIFAGLLAVDPLYEPLRADPRYAALLTRMNLRPPVPA